MAQNTPNWPIRIGNGNVNSGNITSSYNVLYAPNEDEQIMRWLSPLEPNNIHLRVNTGRSDGTGNFLLETGEFQEWRRGEGGADKAVLLCSRNPELGQRYLSSVVIESLRDQAGKGEIAVTRLFCDFDTQHEAAITNMLGAILKQLVGGWGIPQDIREAFREGRRRFNARGPRLQDMIRMFRITLASLPRAVICIDTLNKPLPKHLPKLLRSLKEIVRESPETRIFLTGWPMITEDIRRYFTEAVVIPISPNVDGESCLEMSYLEMGSDMGAEPGAMDDNSQLNIITVIMGRVSDMWKGVFGTPTGWGPPAAAG